MNCRIVDTLLGDLLSTLTLTWNDIDMDANLTELICGNGGGDVHDLGGGHLKLDVL